VAEEGEDGHGDGDFGGDAAVPVHEVFVIPLVGDYPEGFAVDVGEEHVGEDVGAALVEGALFEGPVEGACGGGEPVEDGVEVHGPGADREGGHPVAVVVEGDAPLIEGGGVSCNDGFGVELFSGFAQHPGEFRGSEPLG
jgi:hypothetical protein